MMRRSLFWLVNFESVFMPALSPSMETGTVVEWKKKVGELVNENDVFCTIQTDKAVVDYTNTFEPGYLAKIYCQNGQSAPVASTIAVMVDDVADVAKADEFQPEGMEVEAEAAPAAPAAAASAPAATTAQSSASSEPPEGVEVEAVFMPALSPSMETGTVVEWKKKVGELVNENDVFCTIQTDKAVVDYTNTFEPGYLAKIYCQNGQSAPVASTIAMMVKEAGDVDKVANYIPEGVVGAEAAAPAAPAAAAAASSPAKVSKSAPTKRYGNSIEEAVAASGPSVVRIAAGLSGDVLASIVPTGKGGRFTKSDFSGQPGFEYGSDAPAAAARPASTPLASPAAASTADSNDIYNVVVKGGAVLKSVDDTRVLAHFLSTMPIPKAKKN